MTSVPAPEAIPSAVLHYLLLSVGCIVLPHAWNVPPQIAYFFAVLWLWRVIGFWLPRYLPPKTLLFGLTLWGMAILYYQHQGLFGRDAGVNLFIVALALKLFEISAGRDVYLVVYLAFIVAATLFLYQQSLLMAAYSVLVCVSLLAVLCVMNSNTVQLGFALKTASTLLLQTLPLTLVLFMLFPRLEAPRWAFLHDKSLARSGLAETMEPGSISELGLSDELVFRVKFNGKAPMQSELYWRGPVFTQTDGKQWRPNKSAVSSRYPASIQFSGEPWRYTLLMEPQAKPWVFALDLPAALPAPLTQRADLQVLTTANPALRAEYELRSYAHYQTGALTALEQQENTALPDNPAPRLLQLVQQLQGNERRPEVFTQQVLQYFASQPFYYSLTPPVMETNPIETFLLDTRKGFCSHYATAFVYLMRLAHIPARVVSGYQGGRLNSVGGFFEIRQADAHAWAEVWLAEQGWVRIDPTAVIAPERIEHGVNIDQQLASGLLNFSPFDPAQQGNVWAGWYQTLRQGWQNLDYGWQRWVINYNLSNQMRLLAGMGMPDMVSVLRWLLISITLLTAAVFALLMSKPRRPTDVATRYYHQFCAQLAPLQLHKAAGESATAFAERVAHAYPQLTPVLQQVTQDYLTVRYGPEPTSAQLARLKQEVASFKLKNALLVKPLNSPVGK